MHGASFCQQCFIQVFFFRKGEEIFRGRGEVLFSGGQIYSIRRKNCNSREGEVNVQGAKETRPHPRQIKHCLSDFFLLMIFTGE